MKKKKVGFDIDVELLSELQAFVKSRNMKISDFYREALQEKLEREKNSLMMIYVPMNGVIEKIGIDPKKYEIELREASDKMKENVGAVNEGILREKNKNINKDAVMNKMTLSDLNLMSSETEHDPRIASLFNQFPQIMFYTTKKYI